MYDNDSGECKNALIDVQVLVGYVYYASVEGFDGSQGTYTLSLTDITDLNQSPRIAGETAVSVDENATGIIQTYTISDPENDTLTVSLSGADAAAFTIASNGELSFGDPPNYEAPADAAGSNAYEVTIEAADAEYTTTLDVVVSVDDVDEPGSITLSSTLPVLDTVFEATLTDPDEILGERWEWMKSSSASGPWNGITGATSSSYTPTTGDVGDYLRVTLLYEDIFDKDKELEAVSANAVAMEVSNTPGVTVSKTALTVTEEDTTGDTYTLLLDTEPTANVTVTVAGHAGSDVTLTPDPPTLTFTTMNWATAQTVTVKAANDADTANDTVSLTQSATSTDSDYNGITIAGVTVTVNDNDTAKVEGVTLTPGDGELAVGWTAVPNATGYEVQWKSGSQIYNTTRQATISSGSTESHTIPNLTNGTEYTVRMRATRTGANDGPYSDEAMNSPGDPTDATLSDLELNGGGIIALVPAFDPATETYTASVANRINTVTLTATQNNPNATVAITSDDDTGTPGEAELDLSIGANTLTVTVTAEDATTKTYTITVTRATAPPAPTDCPADTLWCTTLGVGYLNVTGPPMGGLFGYRSPTNLGDLLSTTFMHDETSYTVEEIYESKFYSPDGSSVLNNFLQVVVRPALPHGLVLQLGSRTFTVNMASDDGIPGWEFWNIFANPLSWTAGQHVTVSLKSPSTDATLTGLALKNASDDSAVPLSPPFVTGTKSYTADVLNAEASITLEPEKSDSNATVAYRNASGAALMDADTFKTGFQVALAEDENTIKVKVTAEDGSTTDTYTVVVTRARLTTTTPAPPGRIQVPSDWSLIPPGLPGNADQFRLIFLSSTKTDGTSYDIAGYNTFIQLHAAAGPVDIRAHSPDFRAVGCTPESDARDNTGTTGTGVPIYWLNGAKVANNNADFYDETWENEGRNDFRNEAGQVGLDITQQNNYPYTGCDHDGTENFDGGVSRALGTPELLVTVARPSSSGGGPLSSGNAKEKSFKRPMYGLSPIFQVADPPPTLDLNVNAIATDDKINIAEKAAGFTISGDTGSEGGVSVTVTLDTTELPATSAEADPATWSVSVPADATYITGTGVALSVSASKLGFTTPSAVTRTLTVDLVAPTAPTYTAPTSLKVGEAITAISPSGGVDIDEYAATGLPSGLEIDTNSGAIGGTPVTANASTATATVTASDAAGNTASVDITFPAVAKGDQALSGFGYSASSVTYGSAAPTVTAPTGVLTTLGYSATPATVCTVDSSTGALTLAGAGTCEITAEAAATANYNSETASFTVTVQAAAVLVLNLGAIAGDNTINIAERAAGFDIGGDTGSVSGVSVTVTLGTTDLPATSAQANPATWSVSVPADASYITGTSLDVTVNAAKTGYTPPAAVARTLTVDLTAPTAPTYTAPTSLKVGEAIGAISPSGGLDIDEYGATGLPSGLEIDTNSGAISGTPDTANASTATVTVTVSDAAGNTASDDITFPAVDKGDQLLSGFQYSASSVTYGSTAPTVTAPTGVLTTLGYSATPASVCSVDSSTGALTLAGAGTCEITAEAAATANYNSGIASFTVTVQAAAVLVLNVSAIAGDNRINIAEKAAGFTISGDTGSEIGVGVTVDIGGETLTATSAEVAGTATWSVNVPADATYITGTSVNVTVNAAKTGYTPPAAVTRTLTVDLVEPTAPTYSLPSSLKVGEAITPISASGGVGINEYGATGLPSGLTLNTSSGAISGTPDTADASTATVTVTASDAAGNSDSVDITFPAVAKGDQVLSGFGYSASSVTYGSAAPTVTAPSGVLTTLDYSATPASVCSVDSSSGALTLVNAGTCEIIATAAGSNDYNSETASFTVTVQAAAVLVLNLGTIAGDNRVNIVEKAAGFSIGGDTGSVSGVSVTVTLGTTDLPATSAQADPATWSVSVPADASYITGTSVNVTVNAAKTGYTAPAAVTRSLTVDLVAPTAPSYSLPLSLKVGEAITPISPFGGVGVNQYGATGLPPGLEIDTSSGAISGTPDTAEASTASARVTASDAAGNSDSVDITFPAVAKGDQALSGFGYSASSVTYGSAAPTVTAPSGVLTTLGYSATPASVCSVDSSSGALTLVNAGTCEIIATAAGSNDYNSETASFTVTVQAAAVLVLNLGTIAGDNRVNIVEKAAGFSIGGDTGSVSGVSVTVTLGTTDLPATSAQADPATWSVSVPADASYITGTSVNVTVNAAKTGYTAPAAVTRSLTVDLVAPTAPSYSLPLSLKVGEAITPISPSGGVGVNQYGAAGLPPGLEIDTSSGAISGTPDTADASTATVTVTASDAAGNSDSVDITFPAVAKGDQVLTGFSYSASSVTLVDAAPTVTPPSGAVTDVSYLAEPATVCTVDPLTGALTLVGAGECEITATAEGTADYNEATATFTVTVQTAGVLVLNVGAIADDNIINIAEKASGFNISGDTGTESGVSVSVVIGSTTLTTTSADDAGTATWSVSVPSGATYIAGTSIGLTVSAAKTGFTAPSDVQRTLTVDLAAPTAPTYAAPSSLQVGEAITPISPLGGAGIDEYSAAGLPSGLSLDDSTGVISGTPDTADASTADATVTMSDTAGNTATATIPFPAVGKGDQMLTGFSYSASSVTLVDAAPTVTPPSGAVTDVSYLAEPATVCTVDPLTGALTLVGAGECEITATAEGTADYNEGTATYTVTVQTAGVLVLNVGAIADDNIINIAEKASGFDISGDTGTESGVSVSVVIGSTTLTTTSADDAGTATWSVSVPSGATYIAGTSIGLTVSAAKTGFTAPSDVQRTLTVDLAAPTAPTYAAPSSLQVGEAITPISPLGGAGIDEYSAAGLPSGLSLDDSTGVISGTPDTADASTADATVTMSDTAGNPATVDITFPAVGKGDQMLTGFSYSASSVTLVDAAPTVTPPSGAVTDVSYLAEPATVCTVDPLTGALTLVGAGECEITATAEGTADYNEAHRDVHGDGADGGRAGTERERRRHCRRQHHQHCREGVRVRH